MSSVILTARHNNQTPRLPDAVTQRFPEMSQWQAGMLDAWHKMRTATERDRLELMAAIDQIKSTVTSLAAQIATLQNTVAALSSVPATTGTSTDELSVIVPGSYPYAITDFDVLVLVDTSAIRTIFLPNAALGTGRIVGIKDDSGLSTSNRILVQPVMGQTVDDAAFVEFMSTYGCLMLTSDGSNWKVL